jgi:hypothetical protein
MAQAVRGGSSSPSESCRPCIHSGFGIFSLASMQLPVWVVDARNLRHHIERPSSVSPGAFSLSRGRTKALQRALNHRFACCKPR